MSVALQKIKYCTDVSGCPPKFGLYWNNRLLVPNEVDFYQELSVIKSITIRIFRDSFLECETEDRIKYRTQKATVIITGDAKLLKIGLHLFPIFRIKREELPPLTIEIKDGKGEKRQVQLPEPLASNLLKYLKEGKPHLEFTCVQFLNLLNGFEIRGYIDQYQFFPFREGDILSGDGVLLSRGENPIHVAIYLGEGFYLWHYGPVCLKVTTLEEMIKCYETNSVQIMRPIKA